MKVKNVLKIILKVLYGVGKTCVLGFLLVFALLVCLQRVSDNNISFFKYRLFSVVTGSMSPRYTIGDILLCKEVDVKTLKVGDDISYFGDYGTYKDKVITHRIIQIDEGPDGKLLFYTKGIATSLVDPVVKEDQIYGKITTEVEFMSKLYKFMSTSQGFYICIFAPLGLLIGSEIIVSFVEKRKDKKKKTAGISEDVSTNKSDEEKKSEIKAEIERIEKEIEEKKKAEIKAEIERLQKEIDKKN